MAICPINYFLKITKTHTHFFLIIIHISPKKKKKGKKDKYKYDIIKLNLWLLNYIMLLRRLTIFFILFI